MVRRSDRNAASGNAQRACSRSTQRFLEPVRRERVAVVVADRAVPLGLIERQRVRLRRAGVEPDQRVAAGGGDAFELVQDQSREAAPAGGGRDKHALDLGGLIVNAPGPAAT